MKETGTEEHVPEIKDILETRIDETGVRLYKIVWKTSWLSEGCLLHYKEQIEEFWSRKQENIGDNTSKSNNKTERKEITESTTSMDSQSGGAECLLEAGDESSDDDELETPNNQSGHTPNKRKCSWNLEDIVLKLKRSKKTDNQSLPEASPLPHPTSSTNDMRIDDDEYALSPVFPREMNDDQRKYLNEKSSFLRQLEQKDNMDSLEVEPSVAGMVRNVDETSNSSSSGDERDEITPGMKTEELDKGDFQLAKLLEEEKFPGNELNDKIDESKCNKCNKRFYRRSQLIRHLSNHVIHECLQCNAVFYCVKKYKKHMSTHETYPCDFCSEEFFDASDWYKHRAKHTMVECFCCDMIFYNKTALAKHKFEHSEYICPLCRFACQNLHHWISHRNYHGRCSLLQPIIACRECKTTFATQEIFLKHKCTSKQLTKTSSKRQPENSPSQSSKPLFNQPPRRNYPAMNDIHPRRPQPRGPYPNDKSRSFQQQHSTKPFKRTMNKKEIKDLIGIDQTLTCSS